ncbi:hypothetical protein C7M84_000160 [Penaeus vannamei]|uniref:Uncharacterized protein n=1 Tax=Penaeus vannamei TaxID=6689 RepID=A0A3R7PYK3_PENVA|nr:hypothetical protein C7M84_000160 [Penaeus vannamei]
MPHEYTPKRNRKYSAAREQSRVASPGESIGAFSSQRSARLRLSLRFPSPLPPSLLPYPFLILLSRPFLTSLLLYSSSLVSLPPSSPSSIPHSFVPSLPHFPSSLFLISGLFPSLLFPPLHSLYSSSFVLSPPSTPHLWSLPLPPLASPPSIPPFLISPFPPPFYPSLILFHFLPLSYSLSSILSSSYALSSPSPLLPPSFLSSLFLPFLHIKLSCLLLPPPFPPLLCFLPPPPSFPLLLFLSFPSHFLSAYSSFLYSLYSFPSTPSPHTFYPLLLPLFIPSIPSFPPLRLILSIHSFFLSLFPLFLLSTLPLILSIHSFFLSSPPHAITDALTGRGHTPAHPRPFRAAREDSPALRSNNWQKSLLIKQFTLLIRGRSLRPPYCPHVPGANDLRRVTEPPNLHFFYEMEGADGKRRRRHMWLSAVSLPFNTSLRPPPSTPLLTTPPLVNSSLTSPLFRYVLHTPFLSLCLCLHPHPTPPPVSHPPALDSSPHPHTIHLPSLTPPLPSLPHVPCTPTPSLCLRYHNYPL